MNRAVSVNLSFAAVLWFLWNSPPAFGQEEFTLRSSLHVAEIELLEVNPQHNDVRLRVQLDYRGTYPYLASRRVPIEVRTDFQGVPLPEVGPLSDPSRLPKWNTFDPPTAKPFDATKFQDLFDREKVFEYSVRKVQLSRPGHYRLRATIRIDAINDDRKELWRHFAWPNDTFDPKLDYWEPLVSYVQVRPFGTIPVNGFVVQSNWVEFKIPEKLPVRPVLKLPYQIALKMESDVPGKYDLRVRVSEEFVGDLPVHCYRDQHSWEYQAVLLRDGVPVPKAELPLNPEFGAVKPDTKVIDIAKLFGDLEKPGHYELHVSQTIWMGIEDIMKLDWPNRTPLQKKSVRWAIGNEAGKPTMMKFYRLPTVYSNVLSFDVKR